MIKTSDKSNRYARIGTGNHSSDSVPIPAPGIGTRISMAADSVGTRKFAADAMGVSVDSLARYIREENVPPFDAVARLCMAASRTMEWLATGIEPESQPQSASASARLDRERLRKAIETTDAGLKSANLSVPPDLTARLIEEVYRLLGLPIEADAVQSIDNVIQLFAAARGRHGAGQG